MINLKKNIKCYKKWDIAGMARDSLLWAIVNPIAVNSFEFFFNFTTVGQTTDSMNTLKLYLSHELYSLFHHSMLDHFSIMVHCISYEAPMQAF